MRIEPDSINWLFNHSDAKRAVVALGARNLTEVCSVLKPSHDEEEQLASYSDMIMYGSQQADQKLIEWMKLQILQRPQEDERYIYFRFKRWN